MRVPNSVFAARIVIKFEKLFKMFYKFLPEINIWIKKIGVAISLIYIISHFKSPSWH